MASRRYSTTLASSRQAPPSLRASSVLRASFDRSGFVCGNVRLRLGADAGLASVNIIDTHSGPSRGIAPCMASMHAAFKASRHGFTLADSFRRRDEPVMVPSMPFGKHKGKTFFELPLDYLQWMLKKGDFGPDINYTVKRVLKEAHGVEA